MFIAHRTRLAAVTATSRVAFVTHCHKSDPAGDPPSGHGGVAEPQGTPQGSAPMGSPSATVSPSGGRASAPRRPSSAESSRTHRRALEAVWPPQVRPPKGAPNVLLIMTDDVGFAAPSTLGGVIPTPTLDRIAKAGLRYTAFHSTALCSPTRAALITGRNHHSVHTGAVVEQATGFPGYDTLIAKDTATIGQILKENGYATSWFGKEHNTPVWEATAAGPFDRWPVGYGFQYFYGFLERGLEPVAAKPLPQYDPHPAVSRASRLEPHHGDGG